VIVELERTPEPTLFVSGYSITTFSENLEAGAALSRILTSPSRSPEVRALGHIQLASLALAQGRWSEAKTHLKSAEALDPVRTREHRAVFLMSPFLSVDEAELEAERAEISAIDPGAVRASVHPSGWLTANNGLHSHVRAYLLGLLGSRLGDAEAALAYAAEVEAMAPPPESESLQALRWLEDAPMRRWYQMTIVSPFFSHAYERYLKGLLLAELGRPNEAVRWLNSFETISVYDLVYLAPSHLRRAEILERTGDTEQAAIHYERFTALWSDADPEFRPMVEYAQERLAALASEF
jgi:tetratricopeptide (TPR) repeat protein